MLTTKKYIYFLQKKEKGKISPAHAISIKFYDIGKFMPFSWKIISSIFLLV
jgi:hypothetical protein